ncbi:pleckstrin homology domain-containing family G member 3-like isoform X2 [Gadus macrocephalus]|uniref:pleckstrin homology domain-containing family G member 3-like isoform X2 n=1 Tax=Gadus macrocephalus TaxID=80720 RepID=UPI0028CB2090|nr:pleckstrin homology domain-containing family G member 3-like isoform X2 [Gadus macrocephalus]
MVRQKLMGSVCNGTDRWGEGRWGRSKRGVFLGPGLDVYTIRRIGLKSKHRLGHWLDSPRHSAASSGSTERAPSATPSDGSDPPSAARRPLSLVSTLSSGSASSRDDCQAPPPTGASSPTPSGEDIDLEPIEDDVTKGRGFGGERNNNNSNGSASPAGRTAFRRQPKVATASDAMAPSPQLSYVDRVVMEIIETERMYVRDLRMIVEDYLAHIIDHADLSVGPELVCSLFGNIEDIYEFNSELLQSLDQCDNDPVAIARCFVMKSEYFDIYTQYCTNYPNSVAALTECMRNKSLAKFFRERQASLKRSLPLGSYLLKPVQRILKYHLLLQEIAKHSDQQGADYDVVEEAIYTMTGVAWYINDMKRRHEHAVRLQEVQSLMLHWKGPDLTTYGELVLEGTFKVHRAKNERTLFLFDRMLLITKRRGEHYVYKANISCSTLMLIESAKDSLSFSVTHYKHPKQSHTVQARNLEEKKLWSHHIKRIILENHHAIIPQKAKEAILEMDSIYPSKYRYSPDRLKKALSVQTDDPLPTNRQGRRQSEPIKKFFEGTKAVLKDEEIGSIAQEENHQRLPGVGEPPAELQASEQPSCHQKNSESKPTDSYSNTSSKISASPGPKKPAAEPPTAEPPAAEPPLAEPAVKVKNREEASSASQDSDSKTLSSEESSEEEDHEEAVKGRKATSILPTSVLSRAGAIAQHFQGSTRRPSQASDDALSPNCLSPRLSSRTGSIHSPKITSPCSDGPEVFRPADANMLSPRDDGGGVTGGAPQRRDSTLSKHDQLLIGKIKSYYEVAESHDPAFCLRRRESLTSIPTGLVRNSVSHFNCIPTDTPHPGEGVQGKPSSSAADDNGRAPGEPDSGDQGGIHMKAVSYQQEGTAVIVGGSVGYSSALATAPVLQEEFRSSSEMIQIWQAMEHDLSRPSVRRRETPIQAARSSRTAAGGLPANPNSDGEKGGSDLGTIAEETPSVSKQRTNGPTGRAGSSRETLKLWGEAVPVVRPPRVLELRGQTQGQSVQLEKDSQDDLDSAKSKVLSLARQYSQRIKTSKPTVRVQAADPRLGKRALASVVEESETSGKPSLSLPLVPGHQPRTAPRLSPVEPGAPGPDPGARARSRSPNSPPPTEGFCWPDVRELRSKYGLSDGQTPVGRSMSVPEGMTTDGGVKRRSSYTSPLLPPAERGEGGAEGGGADAPPEDAGRYRLQRTKSLDHRLSGVPLGRLEKLPEEASNGGFHGYYISGEAGLPGDESRRVVVVEKLTDEPAVATGDAAEAARGEEGGENFVQIRSPTSREKISIRAVIDRCRAYQETEEYKLREEDAAKTEAGLGGARGKEPDKSAASSTAPEGQEPGSTQQSVVKNLREKFQKLK